MKYIINYVLFMVVCAVIAPFFKNNAHSSSPRSLNGNHNIISQSIAANYWSQHADLSPAIIANNSKTVNPNTLTSFLGTITAWSH